MLVNPTKLIKKNDFMGFLTYMSQLNITFVGLLEFLMLRVTHYKTLWWEEKKLLLKLKEK